jgi:excisionase family DNA binding protein
MTDTEYLTTAQSAAYLGISERGVRDLCERGRLGRRIGRNWAIPIDEVRSYAIHRLLAGRGTTTPTTEESEQ